MPPGVVHHDSPILQQASVLMVISRGGTCNQGRIWGHLGLEDGQVIDLLALADINGGFHGDEYVGPPLLNMPQL